MDHNHRMDGGDYTYVWQAGEWPNWHYDLAALAGPLAEASRAQGLLLGRLVDVGMAWRDDAGGPMQVVSAPLGRQRVFFEAPPADRLEAEMGRFLDWVNGETGEPPLIKAGLDHFIAPSIRRSTPSMPSSPRRVPGGAWPESR